MSSNQFKQAFTIKIKSTLIKKLLIVLPHVIVAVLLFIFLDFKGLISIYFMLSLLCIAISLIYFVRLHLIFSSNQSIYNIQNNINDDWSLVLRDYEKVNVSISGTSFNSNFLIILNFKNESKEQYTALITRDSVTQSEFRRLKVRIKTRK